MALQQYDAAYALAQTAILKEDRLQLLALVATKRPDIVEQVRHLYSQIEPATLRGRAVDIATDLIVTVPDLAIELIEKANSVEDGENSLDKAYAKLSLATLFSDRAKQPGVQDAIDSIRENAKGPQFRTFTAAAKILVEGHTADQVIAEVERVEGTDAKLYMLRQWALDNREREDASVASEHGLRIAIQTTGYAPNSRVLRELATPLPYVRDVERLRYLVGQYDSQRAEVEGKGPTRENVRLMALLAQAESVYDHNKALNRFEDTFLHVLDIDDLSVRADCEAHLLAALVTTASKLSADSRIDSLHENLNRDLQNDVKSLLAATAAQDEVVRELITALASARTEETTMISLEIASQLNTQHRRDRAYLYIVGAAATGLPFLWNVLESAIGRIDSTAIKSDAIMEVIQDLPDLESGAGYESTLKHVRRFFAKIGEITDETQRCRSYCFAANYLLTQDPQNSAGLVQNLLVKLEDTWNHIDDGWAKVDTGYRIVEAFAKSNVEIAHQYLSKVDDVQQGSTFDFSPLSNSYVHSVLLASRALSGLLRHNLESPDDIKRITSFIQNIPAMYERAFLWSDLALRAYTHNRHDICNRIVVSHIRPLIEDSKLLSSLRTELIVLSSPSVYCQNQRAASDYILSLKSEARSRAAQHICDFLLRKQPAWDAFDAMAGQGYLIGPDEANDICALIPHIAYDAQAYEYITDIVDSVVSAHGKKTFTAQHKAALSGKLEALVDKQFPSPGYIMHEGFKVAGQAQVARLFPEKAKWDELISAARAISNQSDKVYVLGIVANALPSKKRDQARSLLEEAKVVADSIPVPLDRVVLYEDLAIAAWKIDTGFSKVCFKAAIQTAESGGSPQVEGLQRRVIDMAYRLDAEFGASLASLADDDPARESARRTFKRRVKVLEASKQISNRTRADEALPEVSGGEYARIAWMQLGRLNAGRLQSMHFDLTREFVRVGSSLPLRESYPIMAWVTENSIRRWGDSPHGKTSLRSWFNAIALGVDVTALLAEKSLGTVQKARRVTSSATSGQSLVVRDGERQEALKYIAEWFDSQWPDKQLQNTLIIADPYFGPDDLELIVHLQSIHPRCRVQILTGRKHHDIVPVPWEEAYHNAWQTLSDAEPLETEIFIIGTKAGHVPIHDRWWITENGGLRLGGSFNGLGRGSMFEISQFSPEEVEERRNDINSFIERREREMKGEKLLLSSFDL